MLKSLKKRIPAKRAIVLVLICAILAGGIMVWQYLEMQGEELFVAQLHQREKSKKIEITERVISQIANSVLPKNYDRQSLEFFVEDLNSDGFEEIIISARLVESFWQAYLMIVTPTDEIGGYRKVADFSFSKEENIWFRQTPYVSIPDFILDINGDGKKEVVLDLGTGGASNEAYGIFGIDWDLNKINWLEMIREDGSVGNTYFLQGGSVMHQEFFQLKDVNNDGILEIIEKMAQYIGGSGELEDWQKEENWDWQTWVYRWDGLMFIYDEELSNLVKSENL